MLSILQLFDKFFEFFFWKVNECCKIFNSQWMKWSANLSSIKEIILDVTPNSAPLLF